MRDIYSSIMLISIFVWSVVAFAQNHQQDEAAIKALNDRFATAWNNGDSKTMSMAYTKDGCLIDPFGREARGRAAVDSLLSLTVNSFLKSTTTRFDIGYIRFLKQDVAFVDATQTINGAMSPEGTPLPEIKLHLVLSLIKNGGKWWYVDARPYQFMASPEQGAGE